MSEVTDLLDDLAGKRATLDEVAKAFAARQWPAGPRQSATLEEAERASNADPEPIPENSWGEVEAAYVRGVISDEQYERLFQARAGSPRP